MGTEKGVEELCCAKKKLQEKTARMEVQRTTEKKCGKQKQELDLTPLMMSDLSSRFAYGSSM